MTSRSRPTSAAVPAFFLAILILGSASALGAEARIDLRTHALLALDGDVEACTSEGAAMVRSREATGEWTFDVLDGTLEVVEVRFASASIGELYSNQKQGEDRTPFALQNASVTLTLDQEAFVVLARPTAGRVCGGGLAEDEGSPVRLSRDVHVQIGTDEEAVDARWKRGWWFTGSYEANTRIEGFPAIDRPSLSFQGEIELSAFGGTLTFEHDGRRVSQHLGTEYEEGRSVSASEASAGSRIARTVHLRGILRAQDLPAADSWGIAGPDLGWSVQGTTEWAHASGEASFGSARSTFEDATVQAFGDVAFRAADAAATSSERRYLAEGRLEALAIDGAILESQTKIMAPPPAAAGIVAIAVAGLAWVFRESLVRFTFLAYTRLTPADALRHPMRTRIAEEIRARPGLRAGELHALVGGAWGPFRFHLRVLESFGIVRLERRGRYTVVLPAATASGMPIIPHETQRRVFEALPPDGAPVAVRDLVSRTGLTRQLVHYHLSALARSGLVARAGSALGPRLVRRQAQPAEPPRVSR